jgi:hypothetical protein
MEKSNSIISKQTAKGEAFDLYHRPDGELMCAEFARSTMRTMSKKQIVEHVYFRKIRNQFSIFPENVKILVGPKLWKNQSIAGMTWGKTIVISEDLIDEYIIGGCPQTLIEALANEGANAHINTDMFVSLINRTVGRSFADRYSLKVGKIIANYFLRRRDLY